MNRPPLSLSLLAVTTVLCLSSTALAADLTLSPSSGPAGSSFAATGTGFSRNEPVEFVLDGTSMGFDRAESGLAHLVLTMPEDALPGSHAVEAVGQRSGLRARATFQVRTDWNQFGFAPGLGRNNPHEQLLDPRSVESLQLSWRASTSAAVVACPTLHSGILLVPSKGGLLYGFDSRQGNLLWKYRGGGDLVTAAAIASFTDPGSLVGFDPQPEPPVLVALGTRRGLDVVELRTGRRNWSASVGSVLVDPLLIRGFDPQPDPPQVFVTNDEGGAFLFDLDGRSIWQQTLGAPASGAPAAYGGPDTYGGPDSKIVVGLASGELIQLDLVKGAVDWRKQLSTTRLAATTVVPATRSSPAMLLVGDGTGLLHALRGDGSVLWNFPVGGAIDTAVALGDATKGEPAAFLASSDGVLHAFSDLRTPQLAWKHAVGAPIHTSPAVANGVVYFTADDRELYAVAAADGAVLFRSGREDPVLSAPIVCDGSVYVGTAAAEILAFH